MFSRILTLSTFAFWLVMTWLLAKKIHFPDTISRTPIPTGLVIDTLFSQERPGGQFDLLQNNRELGIVTIIPRERETGGGIRREIVLWNGGIDEGLRWNALIILSKDSKSVDGFELKASVIGTELEVEIDAQPGADSIDYVVRNAGQVVVDSTSEESASAFQEQTARSVLATMGFQTDAQSVESTSGEIKTYEQTVEINGRKRDVYTLVASLGPGREITAHFNRSGEILAIYSFFDFELRPAAIVLDSPPLSP